VSEPMELALLKIDPALAACARLIRFYYEYRNLLDRAAAQAVLR
jgi:hypothetical protein